MSIPRRFHRRVPNSVPFGAAVNSFPILEFVTPYPLQMPPGVLRGDLDLAYVHSQMNPQTWTKVDANRSSRLTVSPALTVWPLMPPPPPSATLCLEGKFVWRISIPRWICICVPHLVPIDPAVWPASQFFWICDTLTPPSEMPPGVLSGDLHLVYVHSQMNPQMWT